MTVVAVLIVFGALPVLAILLRGLLPTVVLIAAIYGRGDVRTFAIGAFVCYVPMLTADIGPLSFSALVLGTISQLVVMGICGAAAVATRRWLVGRGLADRD
jgi:hypothetical protein